MNLKIFQTCRIPSLLLAAMLQFMPMVRAALPAVQSASNLLIIVFRWGAAAAATLGSVQAVSGASTIITTTNFTATNGVASTNRLLTAPQVAGWWSASGLPPGISLAGSGSSWRLVGTPTTTGVYTFTLMAWSSSTAPTSERTTNSNCKFTIVAGGGGGASNSPPVANAQSVSTPEDTAKAITLTGSDPNGNALTYAIVTSPTHGTVSGTAPNVTYTPAANYNGADNFTFRVNDGTNNSAAATVSITVTAVNDAPLATAQNVTTAEDTAKAIALAGTDVDGNALTYAVVAAPAHGSLSGTAPNVTYTPVANYSGADSFTFKANDGTVDSATATVSITVTAVNDPPTAIAQSVSTDKNVAKAITLTGSDVEGSALTFTVVASPTKGALSGTAPNLTYTPNINATGADSFTFKVNDGTVDSVTATVAITIAAGPNTVPVADAQSVTTAEDTAKAVTLTGSDADGNPLTFAIIAAPSHGTLSGTGASRTFTPAANYNGSDSFTFRVNDGFTNSTTAIVSIAVTAVNDAPVATAQSVSTTEDIARAITLAGSDADGDLLAYTIVSAPTHGALSGTAPNLAYTPATNFSGTDSVTFKVNDGTVDSATATVSITVTAVNDAPIATAQNVSTTEDAAKVITLSGSDAEGSALTYTIVTAPSHGTLTGTGTNRTYTPATNYNGADTFWFKANDGALDSALAVISITVTPVNDAPLANVQSLAVQNNTAKPVTLTGSDADGDALSYVVVTPPAKGLLSGTAPNLTYMPNTNATGADSFTFKVNDGTADSATATVSLNIAAGANNVPMASAQSVAATEDTAKVITLTGTDADGNALTYAIVVAPAHGTLSGTPPNVTYTPAANFNGADSFTFRVNDGATNSAAATVSVTVAAVNDAPTANAQSVAAQRGVTKLITLTGADVDGDTLTYSIVTGPVHGTLSGTSPNLTYTSDTNYAGTDSFTFVANDGFASSTPTTVTINVTAPESTSLPIVSVAGGANAGEPSQRGSFLFTRTGNTTKSLTVLFTLEGTAVAGADFSNPGNKVTFSAGKTNATLWIRPISDRAFEGVKTVVLTLAGSTNFDAGSEDSASILIGDDDRPRISISALQSKPEDEEEDDSSSRSSYKLQTKVNAAAYTNFSLILQCSTDLTNWTVAAAPPVQQPVDFVDVEPTGAPTRFYRVIYVRGEVTEASVAEAIAYEMFSANIVGVVNVPMQPGWNLAANPLNGKTTDGPLGSLPEGAVFVPFQTSTANNYRAGRWSRGIPLTRSTQGGWFYNPSSEAVNITYVGEIPGIATKPTIPAGWSVRSSPVTTTVSDDELLGYPLHAGDALYDYNPSGTGAEMWTAHQRGPNGWDATPTLTAGQGVLIYKSRATRANFIFRPPPPTPNLIRFEPVEED